MSKIITAQVEYISGHLRYGHYECNLTEEEYEEYKLYSEEEKKEYIIENGTFTVDDYSVEDIGDITDININDV